MNFGTKRRAAVAALAVALVAPAVLLVTAGPASAAFLTVTDGGDTGAAGQLRQVVAAAGPGDIITFAPTVPTVALTQGEILLNKNLTIRGNGPAATAVTRSAQAATAFRIFHVSAGVTATIDLLTVTGGLIQFTDGGGLFNEGTLTVTRSTVAGNTASGGPNGAQGGGIASAPAASLTVSNSVIVNNSVTSNDQAYGGGIAVEGGPLTLLNSQVASNGVTAPIAAGGGAIGFNFTHLANPGLLTVTDSVITGNTATGVVQGRGGGIATDQPLSVLTSTIQNNTASASGPTGLAYGGGIVTGTSTATIERTEIANNTASAPSGTAAGGGLATDGANATTASNTTFHDNTAGTFGGAVLNSVHSAAALTLTFTTVAANSSPGGAVTNADGVLTLDNSIVSNGGTTNCLGAINQTGANDTFGANGACVGTITADPQLSPPALNGGTNRTMALGPTSPAIDAAVGCAPSNVDQRGFIRPAGAGCDLGAYEAAATLPDTTPPTCKVVGVLASNPKQMDVSVQDLQRGLQAISNPSVTNGTIVVPYFTPGATQPVVLAAVKANQALATSWSFDAVDQGLNSRHCS